MEFLVYNLGRRIHRLSQEEFKRLEKGELAYPAPLQHHALLGLVGWKNDDRSQHFIWFLKLPLDELGLINPAARDQMVNALLKQIHQRLLLKSAQQSKNDEPSQNNVLPHSYTPGDETMALFHAKLNTEMKQPASCYYAHAHAYFCGEHGYEQWAFVAMQGIADVVVRLEQDDNLLHLQHALRHLPDEPFGQLYRFLEHQSLPTELCSELISRAESASNDSISLRHNRVAALRALAGAQNAQQRRDYIKQQLQGEMAHEIEILAAISGRCWSELANAKLAALFLAALADNTQAQVGFDHLLLDLLAIPEMRDPLMSAMRDPQRPASLSKAMGKLFARL